MAPTGVFWGSRRQPLTKVILSVAALNELELEQPEWDFSNKPAEFMSKFPYGKIPALETSDGFKLIEGVPVARYLSTLGSKVNLLGSDAKEQALVDQWTHFSEQEIGGPAQNIMGLVFGFSGPFNREALDKQKERLANALRYVESHLAARPSGYLVSDTVTLADFVLAGMAYGCSFAAIGAAERAQYPSVFDHYKKVTEDERVKQFWGTKEFTEVAYTEPSAFPHPSS